MAEAKKKPGRPPGSKNKKTSAAAETTRSTSNSTNSKKSSGSKDSKARERAREIQAERKADRRVMDEIWAIIAIAVGIFLVVATFTRGAGQFGEILGNGLKGILGHVAYIFPFYMIIYGILLFAKKTVHISLKSGLLIFVLLLMMTIMNSVRFIDPKDIVLTWESMKDFYSLGVELKSGGLIGMVAGSLLVKWFGTAGCWIFSVVISLISLLLLINTPVSRFVGKMSDKIEERRLIRENAHLDYLSEDEQGVQVAMDQVDHGQNMMQRPLTRRKKPKQVLNSSVLEEQEPAGSGDSAEDNGQTRGLPQTEELEEKHVGLMPIIKSMADHEEEPEPSPLSQPSEINVQVPKQEYIPPSKLTGSSDSADGAASGSNKKKNSVLMYMQDDSLFDHTPGNSIGLEDRIDYGEGFGLDGGTTVSSGSVGLSQDQDEPEAVKTKTTLSPVGVVSTAKPAVSAGFTSPKRPAGSDTFVSAAKPQEEVKPQESGTPAAEVQQKISNKEAREAMLTKEELSQAAKPVRIYHKPPVDLLTRSAGGAKTNNKELQAKAMKLEETLKNFHVDARVVQVTQGPTVTRYEIQPAVGVKVSSIVRLSDDIALNLEAKSIRIEAPIPGKAAVGIEVENDSVTMVKLRDIIDSKPFKEAKSKITFAVGKDISGNAIVADLKSMPHLLIAGSTGSGKSVCINSIILSLLYKSTPDEVKLILVDPKVVELGNYNGIPHLLIPVVTDPSKAAAALNWAVAEMTDRYKKFAEAGVRDLESYNEAARADGDEERVMPQVVIIIDELADLMMAAPSQIEESICRLAQMARAAGMHLIVATQRPSVDVITGVIKANIPSRIAFAVSSQVDSRTILDMQGAEKLVGKGDMLFNPMGMGKPIRVQGTFVSDGEVNDVIQFVKSQVEEGAAAYNEEILTRIERTGSSETAEEADELLPDAIDLVVHSGQASVSMLQRRFRIGYNRAARIVDMMEARGIIGPQDGSRPRQVLLTEAELEELKEGENNL